MSSLSPPQLSGERLRSALSLRQKKYLPILWLGDAEASASGYKIPLVTWQNRNLSNFITALTLIRRGTNMKSKDNKVTSTKCPCCRKDYRIKDAAACFRERLNHIYLLYALCPNCKHQHDIASPTNKKNIANRCFINIKTRSTNSSRKLYPWSITNEIALHTNDYDLVLALENGQQLPRELYDLVEHGKLNIWQLPTTLYGQSPSEVASKNDE